MKRFAKTLIVAAAGISVGLGLVHSTQAAGEKVHKVAVCHGTASAKNPYVLIVIDESGLNGHLNGTAPGHGHKNNPDFLRGYIRSNAEAAAFRRAGNDACRVPDEQPPS